MKVAKWRSDQEVAKKWLAFAATPLFISFVANTNKASKTVTSECCTSNALGAMLFAWRRSLFRETRKTRDLSMLKLTVYNDENNVRYNKKNTKQKPKLHCLVPGT